MTPASPQPAVPEPPSTPGATSVNDPSSCCASTRSSLNLPRKFATSRLNVDVPEKMPMSPVQPSRSSRCGQSLGTDSMFERSPHRMLCCSWFTSAFDVVNVPVCAPDVHIARPVNVAAVGADGRPVSSTYR